MASNKITNSPTIIPLISVPRKADNPNFIDAFTGLKAQQQTLSVKILKDKTDKSIFRDHDFKMPPPKTIVERKLGENQLSLPNELHVAPFLENDSSTSSDNPAEITFPKSVFLDCGCWLGSHRHFGMVWGRHVYLCFYDDGTINNEVDKGFNITRKGLPFTSDSRVPGHTPDLDPAINPKNFRDGNDFVFFKEMDKPNGSKPNRCIRIINWAISLEGKHADYDWKTVHIIIPDLHLMAPPIATVWANKGKHQHDDAGSYHMISERSLFTFVNDLISTSLVKENLHVTQLGDSYDLWVGHGFNVDKTLNVLQKLLTLQEFLIFKPILPISLIVSTNARFNLEPLFVSDTFNRVLIPPTIAGLDYNAKINDPKNTFLKDLRGNNVTNSHEYLVLAIKQIQGFIEDSDTKKDYFSPFFDDFGKDSYIQLCNSLLSEFEKKDPKNANRKIILNPAEVAFRLLQKNLPGRMVYIYGNHDNYLIHPDICAQAEIPRRLECFANKALFIEHAHRMENFGEGFFARITPKNNDGETSGFMLTTFTFNATFFDKDRLSAVRHKALKMADNSAENDQNVYQQEFLRFQLGRLSKKETVPYIFVIGHTHLPMMSVNSIKII